MYVTTRNVDCELRCFPFLEEERRAEPTSCWVTLGNWAIQVSYVKLHTGELRLQTLSEKNPNKPQTKSTLGLGLFSSSHLSYFHYCSYFIWL